jgi:Family of unknown function (DUF5681)
MSGEGLKDREVGYGRPPKASRFAPGKSGNPRGRPKGSRPVGAILDGIMSQKVTVSEGGRTRRVSRLEVMLLRLANDAARGDARVTKLLLELKDRYGQPIDGGGQSEELSSDDLKILAAYSAQNLDSRADRGQRQKETESVDGEGV